MDGRRERASKTEGDRKRVGVREGESEGCESGRVRGVALHSLIQKDRAD